jgi:hypothetical protein
MCTVADCRRPAVGFVHKRGTVGEAPEVYVGIPQSPGDMAICADHLPSVMDRRGAPELLRLP